MIGAVSIAEGIEDGEGVRTLLACGAHPCRLVGAPCQTRREAAMLGVSDMPPARATVRVLLVDDQASFRRAARSVIELTPGFTVVAEAETGETSVEAAHAC